MRRRLCWVGLSIGVAACTAHESTLLDAGTDESSTGADARAPAPLRPSSAWDGAVHEFFDGAGSTFGTPDATPRAPSIPMSHRTSGACPVAPEYSTAGCDGGCTDGMNGRCEQCENDWVCGYDYCMSDGDCAAGSLCACGDGNACVPADCRLDSDCGDAGFCMEAFSCWFYGHFHCTTPRDECHQAADCGDGQICDYTGSRWQCTGLPYCPQPPCGP